MQRLLALFIVALAGHAAAPCAVAAAGALPEGFYLSLDDAALVDQGVLSRVWEYVEVRATGDDRQELEVGFVGGRIDPIGQLETAASQAASTMLRPSEFGRFDLAQGRRVALVGALTVGETQLAWSSSAFVPTPHLPGRMTIDTDPRPSPFLLATAAGAPATLAYAMDGDTLSVAGPGGRSHAYLRIDPTEHWLAGAIGEDVVGAVFTNPRCLRSLAADVAARDPHALSAETLQATQARIEATGGSIALWHDIARRGPADVLFAYLAAQIEGRIRAARFLQAEIDRADGLEQMFARYADTYAVLDPVQEHIVWVMDRLHYYDFEPDPARPPRIHDALAALAARAALDPWSLTGIGAAEELAPDGWVAQIRMALAVETERRCGEGG
ncbi:MAG: hypothetical protein R3F55_10320 [Alphaproteobacteria bacterium]